MTSPQPTKILLYGLGAIGSFYAFILSRSTRITVSVVARSNHAAVAQSGILIISDNHGLHRFHPQNVYRYASEAVGEKWDYVVICSKATDLAGTVAELEGVVDQLTTKVVVMQNGVGNEDWFVRRWTRLVVLSAVIWVGATQDSPGVVRQHISESTTIGVFENGNVEAASQRAALDEFVGFLRDGGTTVVVDESIQTPRWKKCIWNAAWNSITTLTSVDCHAWLKSSDHAVVSTKRMMAEAVKVARAVGVPGIDDRLPDELVTKMLELPGPVWTSMYHDSKNRRDMEVEVILGEIVRKGKEKGIEVPTLEILYAMVFAVLGRIEIERRKLHG